MGDAAFEKAKEEVGDRSICGSKRGDASRCVSGSATGRAGIFGTDLSGLTNAGGSSAPLRCLP